MLRLPDQSRMIGHGIMLIPAAAALFSGRGFRARPTI
jgi:hypothetical protein